MATYTAVQLKDYTSVAAVATWSDDKILLFQSGAEAILTSLDLDTSLAGYSDAYNAAVVMLFDWLAANPTGLRGSSKGKSSTQFIVDDLPGHVQAILRKYTQGSGGAFEGTQVQRRDIGLR